MSRKINTKKCKIILKHEMEIRVYFLASVCFNAGNCLIFLDSVFRNSVLVCLRVSSMALSSLSTIPGVLEEKEWLHS